MELPHIVVACPAGKARRGQFRTLFQDHAALTFLQDVKPGERGPVLAEADVLLSWNPARELKPKEFPLLRKLHMLQLLSAGADHVPFRELRQSVVIASNVGAYSEPIAEHVLAMALALAKNLFREHLKLARGEFNQANLNTMLHGAVCGILGFGGIGKATARLMRSLGLRIHAVNSTGVTNEPVNFIGTLRDLKYILTSADVLVISLPLTKTTRGLIGRRELESMKNDAILINVARGDIIDEKALYDHLVNHLDFRAGIDAWWSEPFGQGVFRTRYPFFMLPNVLGSPHNAGVVPGMNEEGARLAAENVKRFLSGEPIVGEVRREDYV